MKVKHPFPKGHRYNCSSQKIPGNKKIHRLPFYCGLSACDPNGTTLWWNDNFKKWGTFEEFMNTKTSYGTCLHNICSVRAAKRHIRKHDEITKGTRFTLISNFVSCNVIITK